jgi:hypothetical protein
VVLGLELGPELIGRWSTTETGPRSGLLIEMVISCKAPGRGGGTEERNAWPREVIRLTHCPCFGWAWVTSPGFSTHTSHLDPLSS